MCRPDGRKWPIFLKNTPRLTTRTGALGGVGLDLGRAGERKAGDGV